MTKRPVSILNNIKYTSRPKDKKIRLFSSVISNFQNSVDAIAITPRAANQIRLLAIKKCPQNPSSIYLRVFVDAGGCSGLMYKFEVESDSAIGGGINEEEDIVITTSINYDNNETLNCRLVLDKISLKYMKGSTVDYVEEMIRSCFTVINNPQSGSACGCGSSFALKNFESNPVAH